MGEYILESPRPWQAAKEKAFQENGWFNPEFIDIAVRNIATEYLEKNKLESFANTYNIPGQKDTVKNVGIVMAGNIPLVGFHDFLCTFISGHYQTIKLSSRDSALLSHLTDWMFTKAPELNAAIRFEVMLKGCDAYIATGSNNSARYFEYYFSRFPHIIRKNRTSVAILNGNETMEQLSALADDVYMYFGLGCRNVTKIYVPQGYDFVPLLESFRKYNYLFDHHKYKNNYDYQLAVLLINKHFYMTNGSVILHQNASLYSPISVLHYEYYDDAATLAATLRTNESVQCLVGMDHIPFGQAQKPELTDFADGIDTLQFLLSF